MNTDATRRHWSHGHKVSQAWRALLRGALWTVKPPEPLAHARIVLTRHSAVRPDFENLTLGFKAPLDALLRSEVRNIRRHGSVIERRVLRAEVLLDDRDDVLTRAYDWQPAPPGQGFLRFEIEEIA